MPVFVPRLVIMVREPVAGRAKTRLARDVGVVAAIRAHRLMIARVARLADDRRWRTLLAVTPDTALASRALPRRTLRVPQGMGDLGTRMQAIFEMRAPGPVVVIGCDIPQVSRADIAAAFRVLGSRDAVIGPSSDGGYWLIGLKRRPRIVRPFRAVRWSTSQAHDDTVRNLGTHSIERLRVLDDVDNGNDLLRLAALIGRFSGGVLPGAA